jgi:hypothetical protein
MFSRHLSRCGLLVLVFGGVPTFPAAALGQEKPPAQPAA